MFNLYKNFIISRSSSSKPVLFSINNQKNFSINAKNLFKQRARFTAQKPDYGKKSGFLLRKTLFTIGFTGVCFSGCAIWSYEYLKKNHYLFRRSKTQSKLHEYWLKLIRTDRLICALMSINYVVCLLFRFTRFQPIMIKYFVLNPKSSSVSQLVLSTFAHVKNYQMILNITILFIYSRAMGSILGPEQFLAFYLTSGVVASLASCYARILTGRVGLSLGSFGAVYACVMLFATALPPSPLIKSNVYPYEIRPVDFIKFVIVLEAICLLIGLKKIDHAANLGGALFGLMYLKYGAINLWVVQRKLLVKWHKFRNQKFVGK